VATIEKNPLVVALTFAVQKAFKQCLNTFWTLEIGEIGAGEPFFAWHANCVYYRNFNKRFQ